MSADLILYDFKKYRIVILILTWTSFSCASFLAGHFFCRSTETESGKKKKGSGYVLFHKVVLPGYAKLLSP